jgi:hypothetical protein
MPQGRAKVTALNKNLLNNIFKKENFLMISNFCSCSVPMNPDMDKIDLIVADEDMGTFEMPKVYYDGFSDVSDDEPMFDCSDDTLLVKRGDRVIKYTELSMCDVLVRDERGEPTWMNGQVASIEGVTADDVTDYSPTKEFRIEEYDFSKAEKKRYRVILEETSAMNDGDYRSLAHL